MIMADAQKWRLYEAERVFDDARGVRHFRSMEQMQAFVQSIVDSDWWQERSGRQVAVFFGRKDSGYARSYPAFSTWRGRVQKTPFITIPPTWAATDITLIHELAHIAAGHKHHHGPEFASTYLEMLRAFSGAVNAAKLQKAFDEQRVEYGDGEAKKTAQVEAEVRAEARAASAAAEKSRDAMAEAVGFLSLLAKHAR